MGESADAGCFAATKQAKVIVRGRALPVFHLPVGFCDSCRNQYNRASFAGGRSQNPRPVTAKVLGQVAQLVEQRTENPRVGGSIPPLATKIPKTNRYRLVFFRLYPPVLARIPGIASRAPAIRTWHFHPGARLSVLRSLWWSRERARGHFLYWRGFWGNRLWLATPGAEATGSERIAPRPIW